MLYSDRQLESEVYICRVGLTRAARQKQLVIPSSHYKLISYSGDQFFLLISIIDGDCDIFFSENELFLSSSIIVKFNIR